MVRLKQAEKVGAEFGWAAGKFTSERRPSRALDPVSVIE